MMVIRKVWIYQFELLLKEKAMTTTTYPRRRILQGAAAVLAIGAVPAVAFAGNDALLADILVGVGDALIRDYIRKNYGHGRWDGHYWHYEGRRYTPREYRDFWVARYQPPAPPPPRPAAPPPHPAPPPHRNPPPPGRGPGPAGGPGRGPGGPGRGSEGPGRGPGPR